MKTYILFKSEEGAILFISSKSKLHLNSRGLTYFIDKIIATSGEYENHISYWIFNSKLFKLKTELKHTTISGLFSFFDTLEFEDDEAAKLYFEVME